MSSGRVVAGKEKQASSPDGKMSVNSFTTYRYLINAIRDTFDTPSGYQRFDRSSNKSPKSQSTSSQSTSSQNTSKASQQAPPATMSSHSSKYSAPCSSYSVLITLAIYLLLLHHTAGNAAPKLYNYYFFIKMSLITFALFSTYPLSICSLCRCF